MTQTTFDAELQRQYYEATAKDFDQLHLVGDIEHNIACQLFGSFLHYNDPHATVLDVGSGTGRFYRHLKSGVVGNGVDVTGIEPVAGLIEQAVRHGVPKDKQLLGSATELPFDASAFDYCAEFGVLHHIRDVRRAVEEMCRVASKGIFISDCNRYGQGSNKLRFAKRLLRLSGLWPLLDYTRTKGKGYYESEGDGVYYSFSVFDIIDIVERKFPKIHYWTPLPSSGPNLLHDAPVLLVFATR
jgi:ubiquinone/menaquinone biosynthesis C-methylase UbiE